MFRRMVLALGAAAVCTSASFAATRTVDNHSVVNTTSACTKAAFTSINAAVLASASGDTVQVCPGTYNESLHLVSPITITGLSSGNDSQTIIQPSAGTLTTELDSGFPASAVVVVDNTKNVTLNNLVIDGSLASTQNLSQSCTPDNLGIYYRNSTGTISKSVVRYIGLMPGNVLTGCQEGQGIYADSGDAGYTCLKVFGTSVHDYDKNGITANDAGTTLDAEYNIVSGVGPTSVTAQNGIQVYLATGRLVGNTVLDNNYVTPAGGTFYTASNILLYQAADGVQVQSNLSTGSNSNIVQYAGNKGTFNWNIVGRAFDTSTQTGTGAYGSDGIDIYGNSNTITGNSIVQSQTNAVFLCGSKNAVRQNLINDAAYGVYEDQSETDNCGDSGSNIAGQNTLLNVLNGITPNDGTIKSKALAAVAVSRLPKPSPLLPNPSLLQ